MVSTDGRRMTSLRLAAALISVTLLAACSNPFSNSSSAAPQRAATLAKGSLVASVSATGAIQPESDVRLSFQATGRIAELKVSRGDSVKKGDVIARLDTADLETALAQAQAGLVIATAAYSRTVDGPRAADVAAAQAALNAANASYSKLKDGPQKADLDAAEAAVRNAQAALRQAQSANDLTFQFDTQNYPGSPVITQLEQARNNLEAAKLQYDRVVRGADQAQLSAALQQIEAARAQLEKARQPARQFDVDQARAEREKTEIQVKLAQRRLDQAVLVAPLDGIISAVNVKAGEDAGIGAAAQPAVVMVDTSVLHIDVTVDEIDVSKLRAGLDVVITLDALPDVTLKGKVDRIASSSTNVSGVVSYAVRVVLAETDPALRPGMTSNASIVLDKRDGVLLAPNWAIRRDRQSGKSYLTFQVDEKTTSEVEVKTGLRNDSFSEIISGASEGQTVVAPKTTNLLGQ
jgi:HlyD family secretion protein